MSDWLRHLRKHIGTKVAQFSNLKGIRFTQSVDTAGAGGETRTPNIQIRSLSEWVNRDRLQQTRVIISVR